MKKEDFLDVVALSGIALQVAGVNSLFGWEWAAILAGSEFLVLAIAGAKFSAS